METCKQGNGLRAAESRISTRVGWEADEEGRHTDVWGRGLLQVSAIIGIWREGRVCQGQGRRESWLPCNRAGPRGSKKVLREWISTKQWWSKSGPYQQQQHHLGAHWKCRHSGSIWDLLDQELQWEPETWAFTSLPGCESSLILKFENPWCEGSTEQHREREAGEGTDRLGGRGGRDFAVWTVLRIGEGNGTALQYSCLENPMDEGAWWAAVHEVTKGRTRLSDFTFTFQFHALENKMATHSSVLAWRIRGMAEPGGLPSMGSHRVWHEWRDLAARMQSRGPGFDPWVGKISWGRAWQPTSIFSPGESPWTEKPGGLASPWDRKESDRTKWLNTACKNDKDKKPVGIHGPQVFIWNSMVNYISAGTDWGFR